MNCEKCIERFKPDDPRVKSGRYHLSSCDYCSKEYSLGDELEELYQRLTLISQKLSGQVERLAFRKTVESDHFE